MVRKCFNCDKDLNNSDSSHIKKCSGLEYNLCRYNQLLYDFKDVDISYDNFNYMYNTLLYSLIDFKNKLGLAYRQSTFLMEYYNIQKRDKCAIKNIKKTKYENTCIEKYGCDNIFKNKKFIENSIKRKKEKYGKAGLGWIYENNNSKQKRIDKLHLDLKEWWLYMDESEKKI